MKNSSNDDETAEEKGKREAEEDSDEYEDKVRGPLENKRSSGRPWGKIVGASAGAALLAGVGAGVFLYFQITDQDFSKFIDLNLAESSTILAAVIVASFIATMVVGAAITKPKIIDNSLPREL